MLVCWKSCLPYAYHCVDELTESRLHTCAFICIPLHLAFKLLIWISQFLHSQFEHGNFGLSQCTRLKNSYWEEFFFHGMRNEYDSPWCVNKLWYYVVFPYCNKIRQFWPQIFGRGWYGIYFGKHRKYGVQAHSQRSRPPWGYELGGKAYSI